MEIHQPVTTVGSEPVTTEGDEPVTAAVNTCRQFWAVVRFNSVRFTISALGFFPISPAVSPFFPATWFSHDFIPCNFDFFFFSAMRSAGLSVPLLVSALGLQHEVLCGPPA